VVPPFVPESLWDSLKLGEAMERLLSKSSFVVPIRAMIFNYLIASRVSGLISNGSKGEAKNAPLPYYYPSLSPLIKIKRTLQISLYHKLNNLFALDLAEPKIRRR